VSAPLSPSGGLAASWRREHDLSALQAQRTTIIIRELPATATEAEVLAIFTDGGLPAPQSVRHDVDWFVTMHDENDATTACLKLRSLQFNGQPIKARMKSEHVLRGAGAAPAAIPAVGDGESPVAVARHRGAGVL
jgi:hypothetical protein